MTLPSRSGARAAGAALVVLVAVAPASGWQSSATAQQSGVSVTLSDDRMHRIVARADGAGGLDMTCIQGDEHTAREVLRSMAATTRGGDLPLTGATGRVAVNGTLGIDPDRPAGADAEGRVLLFTPGEVSPGSSFSHFDRRAEPNLLMEPNISSDLPVDGVDLTDDTLRDLGWRGGRFAAEIVVADPAGQGFNDPVRGADRLAALEHVLGIWGDLLGSAAGVTVEASFGELDCGTSGGVLAAAGPRTVIRDFDGGEPGVWYPGPVAESILGVDQTPDGSTDLRATFNAAVDDGCLGGGSSWYYGTDTAPPGTISFVTVALHELGHGLGFLGLTDLETGELFRGFPDVMTIRAFDNQKNKYWDEFNDGGRRKSARRDGQVALDARRTTKGAAKLLDGSPYFEINAPRNLSGTNDVSTAAFGPPLRKRGITADIVAVVDTGADSRDGCETITNTGELAGRIALVDRGQCTFVTKVANAEAAGAVAVLVANNVDDGTVTMGGDDDGIGIPSVMITRKLGRQIRRKLAR